MSDRAALGTRRPRDWRPRTALAETRHLLGTGAGRALAGAVAVIALLTAIGLVALWPYGYEASGQRTYGTVPATVKRVIDEPCSVDGQVLCRSITVDVQGRRASLGLNLTRLAPKVSPGDRVRVFRPGASQDAPEAGESVHYEFAQVDRRGSLVWLAVAVALVAALLLRTRGVLAVLGAGLSLLIVFSFLVPAILAGKPAPLVALVAALAVTFVTLVLTNGIGAQTLAAALGVTASLMLTCLLAWLAIRFADLDGSVDPSMLAVRARDADLSLPGITLAAILVGVLGVLADTAVTQASAVMALRRTDPRLKAWTLYRSAFVIGRDHLSATIHTLVLAYAGATLPLLLALQASHAAPVDVINNPSIAGPIVATAVGCLALLVAVPLATGLAALLVARVPVDVLPEGHVHAH